MNQSLAMVSSVSKPAEPLSRVLRHGHHNNLANSSGAPPMTLEMGR